MHVRLLTFSVSGVLPRRTTPERGVYFSIQGMSVPLLGEGEDPFVPLVRGMALPLPLPLKGERSFGFLGESVVERCDYLPGVVTPCS